MSDFKATRRVDGGSHGFLATHQVSLIAIKGPKSGATFELTKERIPVGRGESTSIALYDEKASRFHVDLLLTPDGYELHDLESTNGTWVNGQPVKVCMLRDGDVVRIGDTWMRYVVERSENEPQRTEKRPAGFELPKPQG